MCCGKVGGFVDGGALNRCIELLKNEGSVFSLVRRTSTVVVPSHSRKFKEYVARTVVGNYLIVNRSITKLGRRFSGNINLMKRRVKLHCRSLSRLAQCLVHLSSVSGRGISRLARRTCSMDGALCSIAKGIRRICRFCGCVLGMSYRWIFHL